jgi:rod shape determining protein RodA
VIDISDNMARTRRTLFSSAKLLSVLNLDGPLLVGLSLLAMYGLAILYSASGQSIDTVLRTVMRIALGVAAMLALTHASPNFLRRISPWLYVAGVLLLVVVEVTGVIGKGAQRWLNLGFMRFQPSEIMKLGVPMLAAWYLNDRPLPPDWRSLVAVAIIIVLPVGLVAIEPDLGTAALIGASGVLMVLMAGLSMRIVLAMMLLGVGAAFAGWHVLHDYQRQRVLTFLNPQNDPLGTGYHIIQSQIALGSGGVFGKGWMHGSQAQLQFLPERSTDFIFAVVGEEFGLIGLIFLLALYLFIVSRAVWLAMQTNDTYSRLLALSIALTFFVYVFINAGMVSGLVPVVGVPLPLVSYGGTSVVTLLAGFGILMGLYSHRKLVGS